MQNYNIRVVDNGDGTYSLGFIHRLREHEGGGGGGEWVYGSRAKIEKLLTEGELVSSEHDILSRTG